MTTTTKNMQSGEEQQVKSPHQAPPMPERGGEVKSSPGTQLVSFGERITYTFAHGREVGSIHFDRARGEIFYKGHNIRNMDLEEWQMQVMEGLRKTLGMQEQGKRFAESYGKTLDKIILEKNRVAK